MAEHSTPKYKEDMHPQKWKLVLNIFLFSLFGAGMVAFMVIGIAYESPEMRDRCIGLCVLGAYAMLVKTGCVKEKWADYIAKCVGRATMFFCFVVGPLFTIALVGKYFGWW